MGKPLPGRCRICGGEVRSCRTLYDDRYAFPGSYVYEKCSVCSHIALSDPLSEAVISDLYTRYYPRIDFDVESLGRSKKRSAISSWLAGEKCSAYYWVPFRTKVLDIGCGVCESLYHLSGRGCEAHGVEADANVSKVAEKYGFRVRIGVFDPSAYEWESFDCVTLNQVIEHLNDPLATLKGIRDILKPGGRLIVSTPNTRGWGRRWFGRKWIHWHAPYHTNLFNRESLTRAAEGSGFDVERIATLTHSSWLHYQLLHLAMYPKEGVPSPFWTSKTRSGKHLAVMGCLALLHRTKVNHIISRCFDLIGAGDNLLAFLVRR